MYEIKGAKHNVPYLCLKRIFLFCPSCYLNYRISLKYIYCQMSFEYNSPLSIFITFFTI